MMLVPVFVVLAALFGFVAIRNEMVKDEVSKLEEQIDRVQAEIDEHDAEKVDKLERTRQSCSSRVRVLEQSIIEFEEKTRALREQLGDLPERVAKARTRLDKGKAELASLEHLRGSLREELHHASAAHGVRSPGEDRGRQPRPGLPLAPEPDPVQELYSQASQDTIKVLEEHGLAFDDRDSRTGSPAFPVLLELIVSRLWLIDCTTHLRRQVYQYHAACEKELESSVPYDSRLVSYRRLTAEHERLTAARNERAKALKAAETEIEAIARKADQEGRRLGDRDGYTSSYLQAIQDDYRSLKDLAIRPPAEPVQQIR
jgi:septal ring factor EnvC (AmiA/AmiB activator)